MKRLLLLILFMLIIVTGCVDQDQRVNYTAEDCIITSKEGMWGVIDQTQKEIIPFTYGYISEVQADLFKVEKNSKYGYLSLSGEEIIPLHYDGLSDLFHEKMILAKKGDRWGLIDLQENVILPFDYNEIQIVNENLFAVEKAGVRSLVDALGEEILSFGEFYITIYSEGLITIGEQSYQVDGNILTELGYWVFGGEGEGRIPAKKENKYGYVDTMGGEVIPFMYDHAFEFSESLAVVIINGKYGCIDPSGEEVIPFIYEGITSFEHGRIEAYKDDKWGIIDNTGKEIIPFIYDHFAYTDYELGLIHVRKDKKYGFISLDGVEKIPFIYDGPGWFSEDLAVLGKEGKYGFIDPSGKEVIPFIYDYANSFYGGVALVQKDGVESYVNREGKVIDYDPKKTFTFNLVLNYEPKEGINENYTEKQKNAYREMYALLSQDMDLFLNGNETLMQFDQDPPADFRSGVYSIFVEFYKLYNDDIPIAVVSKGYYEGGRTFIYAYLNGEYKELQSIEAAYEFYKDQRGRIFLQEGSEAYATGIYLSYLEQRSFKRVGIYEEVFGGYRMNLTPNHYELNYDILGILRSPKGLDSSLQKVEALNTAELYAMIKENLK